MNNINNSKAHWGLLCALKMSTYIIICFNAQQYYKEYIIIFISQVKTEKLIKLP